jgi:hypothetical protein
MNQQELKNVLEKHRTWVLGEPDGERANLSYANLSYANLSYANLSYANLSYANLSYANLSSIKEDFFKRLALAKGEIVGLLDALVRGKVDGTSYTGQCACFVGTIANIRKENYQELTCDLRPNADSPTERWFMGIREGDTPESNQVSKIVRDWIKEFSESEKIILPEYKLISSVEFPAAFL